jgi:phospholipid/cholesterol/gamma-HCH transport system permease protein
MAKAGLSLSEGSNNSLVISLTGDWLLNSNLPGLETVFSRLSQVPKPKSVAFESDTLGEWNTGLVKALIAIVQNARANTVEIDDSGLPNGAQRLVSMAFAVEERQGARRVFKRKNFLEQVGESVTAGLAGGRELLAFTGEIVLSCGRFLRGKATFQRSDVTLYIQEAGIEALPIVSLICFLIGMIFAFVGVIQLESFGAGIYTADLVAVAMVREMSAIMTGIIMAGRTGAAYAAQIGTMKVNEEIDALTTLGMHPIDFMVTPRVFALILMMPLLTVYASLMGIMGGALVGLSMLDVTLQQYVAQTLSAVHLNSLFGGLFKSIVYGILIALVGCQQGMACGNSAMAVGQCTTKAVVMGIVLIVASASILTVIYINLGI